MKPQIKIAFAYFWHGFTPAAFKGFFPYVYDKYDLVLSRTPEVVFYSVFSPQYQLYRDQRFSSPEVTLPAGDYLRVFFTGENYEPVMDACEFAISFSTLVNHPNHLRLPLWVYENRGWGYGPERLIKAASTECETVAREKTGFCNFVYPRPVPFRNHIFSAFNAYKRVDAAGPCLNNMNGWCVPKQPNRLEGKVQFLKRYKFTLAVENTIWPGYVTEKLVDPMFAGTVPIYIGDPTARRHFDTASYVDFADFDSMTQMFGFVRELDNDDALYLKMLAAPYYRNNTLPAFASEARIAGFFDKIFAAALARRK